MPSSGEIVAMLLPLDKDDFTLPIPPSTPILGVFDVEGWHMWFLKPTEAGQTHFILLRAGDKVPPGYEFVTSTQSLRGAVKLVFRQKS